MKKIIFILFLINTLISCRFQKEKDTYTIGISQCSDDAWRRTMNDEILREASFHQGIKVKFRTAFDSNQKQIRDIENLISEKVDLLIVSPNEAIPLTPVIEKAMQNGIPVILVDRKTSNGQYTAYVGADNYQIGREVGTYIANLMNGKGHIVEIRGLKGSTPDFERHNGFMSVISSYPDIKIVHQSHADWLRKTAKEKITEACKENTEIDLVFAHNDEMAIGIHEAYTVMPGKKKPLLIGIDALPDGNGGIQQVVDGVIDATFIYPTGGEKAVQTAVKILKKEPFNKENILYTAVVDKTNARVLKLQTDQIIQHQYRIGQLNEVLDYNLELYSTQRIFLYFSLSVLFIILVLLLLLWRSNIHKNRVNKELEKRNIAINQQKEILSEQKDQLITLSKNLEEATQAKLVFFTNISHEFRTPLTLLHGPLETIAKNETLSSEAKNLLVIMRKNVQILMKLIDQIIEFRRFENGKMQMYFTLSDLSNFIGDICNSFVELCKKKHIHLSFVAEKEDFTLWFDSDKMEKICYNLISNAVKFTPENGHIKILLTKKIINDQPFAKLTIIDTGTGISEQHIQQIFDRFYRIDNSVKGSGIGLALTKVLVEQHNGQLEVESVVGKGSTFSFVIPFKQKDIAIAEQYPTFNTGNHIVENFELLNSSENDDANNEQSSHTKPLALIVEDNADVRFYIKSLLKSEFEIVEAAEGQSGLHKAMKHVPDIIISDIMMDGMNGFDMCRQIKQNLTTSHIPVILLTACTQDEQRATGYECGADSFISKPFNEEVLRIRVKKIIENRETLKEYFKQNLTFGGKKESVTEIDQSFMSKFKKIIEDNLIDSDLNIDNIGKNLGLSRVQLYRKIKSLTNYAPNELVRIIRLKAAEQQFINSEKTISEVAYETGFSSPSYFTKCFKEYYNESPTDFIKRVRQL